MQKKPYHAPYCLYCYASLGVSMATDSHAKDEKAKQRQAPGASLHCPKCERVNLVVDTHRFWSKETRLVELEWWLKAGVMVLVLGISAVALLNPGTGLSAAGHGMAAGAPILIGILLWDLASITLKRSLFNGAIVWGVVAVVAGLLPAIGIFLVTQGLPLPIRIVLACLPFSFAVGPILGKSRFEAWREARIARGQATQACNIGVN